jgi:prepilin-type N-terminal cleavage/methylation domain-containing protein
MRAAGFSLIEVLVATAVVSVGITSLAQLFAVSARANRTASATTMTLLLAQQKMEELRADAAAASASPPSAFFANTPGYFDHIDRNGKSLGGGSTVPPGGAIYLRRWAVEPLEGPEGTSGSAGSALVLKVRVLERSSGAPAEEGSGTARAPGEARLVSVTVRRAG